MLPTTILQAVEQFPARLGLDDWSGDKELMRGA
jgi:hypothetical protein